MAWAWDFIWKLHLPPKIKTFIWLIGHGKILTNVQRERRNLTADPNCHRCKFLPETMEHMFKDCQHAQQVWNSIEIPPTMAHTFSLSLDVWVMINLKSKIKVSHNLPWVLVFITSLWHCWKWRCCSIFNVGYEAPPHPQHIILQFAREWYDINKVTNVNHTRVVTQVLWHPPSLGNVKLNVDGSCKNNSGLISVGGLLRNTSGTWICGFSANLGIGNILEAELWSLFRGLQMAWVKNIRSLDVECDSMTTVTLITKTCEQSHPLFCLIEDCKEQ